MASFGEELKRERELRDISLKEISEATKISIRFLEALEQNNFDVLPGGVFNRGFIRAYARFIGVDGEEMVNAYLHEVALREARQAQALRGPQRAAAGMAGAGGPTSPETAGAAPRTDARFLPRGRASNGGRPESRGAIRLEPRFSPGAVREALEGRTSAALWVLVVLAFFVGVGVITTSFTGGRPVDASGDAHAQARRARPERQAAATAPSAATVAPQPTPASSGRRLWVRATEATRVVVECGGRLSLDEELWPGQSRTLSCTEPVLLSASNGGAVEYSLDGGPAALLGEVGQQVDGLRVAPPPPSTFPQHDGAAPGQDPDAER